MAVTYDREKQYSIDTLVQLSISFYHNQLTIIYRQDFQLPSISTITKMTSKRRQLYRSSSFSNLAMSYTKNNLNRRGGRRGSSEHGSIKKEV